MTEDSQDRLKPSWLLSPPGQGEIQVHIAVGEGVDVTTEVREALESLLESLQQKDVEGYMARCNPKCPELNDCVGFYCTPLNSCGDLVRTPCAVNVSCVITKNLMPYR